MTNPIDNHRSSIINWEEVHRRLDAAKEALEKGWSPSEAEKKRILKTRAEVLAREPDKIEQGEQIEVVGFTLSYEQYGVESLYVREVYPLKEYTPVPCTPAFVLGIINLRGEILSILDLRKFFRSSRNRAWRSEPGHCSLFRRHGVRGPGRRYYRGPQGRPGWAAAASADIHRTQARISQGRFSGQDRHPGRRQDPGGHKNRGQ